MLIAVLDSGRHGYKFCCLGGNGVILAEEGGSDVSETSSQGVCHASVTSITIEEGGYEGGGELKERGKPWERGGRRGERERRREEKSGGGEVEVEMDVGRELGRERGNVKKNVITVMHEQVPIFTVR